ncbi:MAG TPA: hypothetical protein P5244_02795 [Syntrophales bacterium]|jgi:hypothetical protein|nr:hypothetical protein [Syntrophales bacterium]HRR87634.1 hypothetical protein [Phycisphaerae bacterium]
MRISSKLIWKGTLFTGRPSETVRKQQVAAMHEATQFTSVKVKERTPEGVMGEENAGLADSIQPEVRKPSTGVIGIVGTPSLYGLVVEKGRRPGRGRPPQGVLLRWIEVKMGVSAETAEKIEPAVRWKIAKKGTEGAHMFEKTLDEDWPDIERIFQRYGVAIAKGLSR